MTALGIDDVETFTAGGSNQSGVEAYEVEVQWLAVSGDQGGGELQAIGSTQWVSPQQSLCGSSHGVRGAYLVPALEH
jgi:hypothetical protein